MRKKTSAAAAAPMPPEPATRWEVTWLCAVCGELHTSVSDLEADGVTPCNVLMLSCLIQRAAQGYAATQRAVKLPAKGKSRRSKRR